jgi:N6-L-threonylcarbamoyladenine synthase
MTACVLGVDTSNYTTSLCVISAETGQLLAETRQLLPVDAGERGLRQSEALFFHVQHLPVLMSELMGRLQSQSIRPEWSAVGVSVRPRPFAASYMPVFHAGAAFAESFALAVGIPLTRTSHQEGHIAAAEYEHPMHGRPFVAVHISGGTCDVVLAVETPFGYRIQTIGTGSDLHVGQFVDRVGVALGLPFPAGPSLERLSLSWRPSQGSIELPAPVKGADMSFSGPLSAALRAIADGHPPEAIARAVEACVARAVSKSVEYALRQSARDVADVLIVGGVASNAAIRRAVTERVQHRVRGVRVCFAPAPFARDNALGVARIAFRRLSRGPETIGAK